MSLMHAKQFHAVPRTALSVAIAGALAVPVAAQAVDFTISGHVNRAMFLTSTDGGSNTVRVWDNGESSTRINANGSTELENGSEARIQLEYEYRQQGVRLRHANVQYGGPFGRITLGQGSEAGDGAAYSDTTGVFGIGHGAGTPPSGDWNLGAYFDSLDAGGRVNMIRYDTPALGPVTLAVSASRQQPTPTSRDAESYSSRLSFSNEIGGTAVGANLAMTKLAADGAFPDRTRLNASAGATLPSGLTLSGTWAKEEEGVDRNYLQAEVGYLFGNTGVAVSWWQGSDFNGPGLAGQVQAANPRAQNRPTRAPNAPAAAPWTWPTLVSGAKSTALGIGAKHTLPKANAELYIGVQHYSVDLSGVDLSGLDYRHRPRNAQGQLLTARRPADPADQTVYVVGSRIKF